MSFETVQLLIARLADGRPGLLGWPGFYLILLAAYAGMVTLVIVQSLRQARASSMGDPAPSPPPAAAAASLERNWLVLLLALGLARGLVYSTLNPPWFAPDEPPHFEYTRMLSALQRIPAVGDSVPQVQRDILASMYQFEYWRLNNMQNPDHPPVAFAAGLGGDWQGIPPSFVVNDQFLWYFPQVGNEPPLYYMLTQPAMWPWLSGGQTIRQFYWARWITMMFYIACVVLAYVAGRYSLADIPGGAGGLASLVAFHSMLCYMGTSVNNDIVGAALGAAWFAVAAWLFARGPSWVRLGMLMGLTLLAVFIKKTTLFVYPLLFVAMGLSYWSRHPLRLTPRLGVALAVVLLGVLGVGLGLSQPTDGQSALWVHHPPSSFAARSSRVAHDGTHAFDLSCPAEACTTRLVQIVPDTSLAALRGQTLLLEAAVYAEPSGEAGRLALVDDAGPHAYVFTAGSNWQTVHMTYTLPANAQFLRVLLMPGDGRSRASGRVYFDAVSLSLLPAGQEMNAPTERTLLYNGSAEYPAALWQRIVMGVAQPLGLAGYVTPWFAQPSTDDWRVTLPLGADVAFETFWGRFGSLNVRMPLAWRQAWQLICLVGALGMVLYAIVDRAPASRLQRFYVGLALVAVAAAFIPVMLPMLKRPDPQWIPQGRLLLPIVLPIATLLILGWSRLLPTRLRPWLMPVMVVGSFVLDSVALVTLVVYSYPVPK